MNLSLTDVNISISISRLSSPLVPGIDFNWTVLNYTERWIHVKLDFSKPLSVSQDDVVMVAFPDRRFFVSNGKLLDVKLVLNQTMKAIFPDKQSAKFIVSLGRSI